MAPPHEHQHHQQEHQHQQHQRQNRRHSRGPAQQQPRPTALELLFGVDLDAYIAAHQEEYEALQKKWSTCSLEEWQAGAGGEDDPFFWFELNHANGLAELGDKFSAVLDFVSFSPSMTRREYALNERHIRIGQRQHDVRRALLWLVPLSPE
jgi:hypothetical protein